MKNLKWLFRISIVTFILGAMGLLACDQGVDKKMILGEWKGVEWMVEGQSSGYDATSASFAFRDDGTYSYTYADALETGKYYIVNQELYTTPVGGVKMMVKIVSLTPDSLVFDMNRGGVAERLTLVRR